MASEEASSTEVAQNPAADPPSNETIAAALEEALQNARLLRVSSSIFLKEAKELLDSGRAAALLWAADCLEGLNEVEKERLAGVKEATATNSVPLVPVQSKKQLAEWVGLGKIGRLRRNAACLLAVVLHSADGADTDEAPALSKLLENYPQAPKPSPKPISTQRVSSAGSKVTTPKTAKAHSRHSYTPDAVSFRSAFTGKDTLPVLKRTGSSAPGSRRESADGAASLPSWALSRREAAAPEKSQKVAEKTDGSPEPRPAAKKSPWKQQKEPAAAVANGKSSPAKAAAAKSDAPEISPAEPAEPREAPGKTFEQEAAAVVTAAPDVATPAAKPAPASDAFTPGASLPGTANSSAAAQATPSETVSLAGRSGSVARPEEVSAFRMARRKRTSSNAAAMPPPNAAAASDEAADGAAQNGSVTAVTADETK
ncbi:hypothetical protein WJX75_009772 [Coccomyxa subellipsoidea]|uniref:HRDC domain-containing protein n=1 Tax=Coccomyxa subellipsoidea TaxID=248742 RepID=A0ABR2YK14_9CHLO